MHKYAYVHGDPVQGMDPSGNISLIGTAINTGIRAGLFSAAVGAIFRVPYFAYRVFAGQSLSAALWDLGKGLLFDFAVGAVLGGAGAGLARFAPNAIKLRAVGQSISQFRFFRLPWSVWRNTGSVAANKIRGLLIEKSLLSRPAAFLGRQIANFPVIDDYIIKGGRGIATSIKSLDLTAASYQTSSALLSRLNTLARPLQNLAQRTWGGFTVGNAANPITDKILVIAFEQGAVSSVQAQAITLFLREAATKFPGVKVVIQFIA